jgi:hypothetical protein
MDTLHVVTTHVALCAIFKYMSNSSSLHSVTENAGSTADVSFFKNRKSLPNFLCGKAYLNDAESTYRTSVTFLRLNYIRLRNSK